VRAETACFTHAHPGAASDLPRWIAAALVIVLLAVFAIGLRRDS
jgi:hypothetical protein